jgi:hypothetical protein
MAATGRADMRALALVKLAGKGERHVRPYPGFVRVGYRHNL